MNPLVRTSNVNRARRVLGRALACGALLVLPSCGIPHLRQPEPPPALPPAFAGPNWSAPVEPPGGAGATCLKSSAQLGIAEFYSDPMLLNLLDQALAGNRELMILDEEVEIARNEVQARRGAYLPFVTFGASAGLEKPSLYTPLGTVEDQLEPRPGLPFPEPLPNYLGAFNLFWRLDVWRELRNARDAASQRLVAATERRNYFVTRLIAEIAENYYALVALDKRLENLEQIIELQESSYKIAKVKMEAGRGTDLAVQRFLAEVRNNQSELLIVKQEIVQVETRINLLANRFPQPVARQPLDYAGFLDLNIQLVSMGVPAQLLQNRPDVRQAERELQAAGLDVRVARAHFFPRLDLSAGVGYEAFQPRFLFTPESLIYNVAGNLVAPVINKAAIRAEYRSANAAQLQSAYNYQRAVLNAFAEVVNRLSKVENFSQSIERKKQRVTALEAAVESASKLFQAARVEYIEVLLAQRDLQEARAVLIETKREQLAAIVNTYQALGGGWQGLLADARGQIAGQPCPLAPGELPPAGPAAADEVLPPPRGVPVQPDK